MRPRGVSGRLILCLVLDGCAGDSQFDPDTTDITGIWNTRIEDNAGDSIACTTTWSMSIETATRAGTTGPYASAVPLDARIDCTDGYSSPFTHRGVALVVEKSGARLTFLTETASDTFAKATVIEEGLIHGTVSDRYLGGELTARRRSLAVDGRRSPDFSAESRLCTTR